MKRLFLYLIFLNTTITYGQTNSFPVPSGNAKIFAVSQAWAEGLAVVTPSGWGGVRFTRNDPASGNFNGNWAIGYNASTGNDFSISTNYNSGQYDGLFHISNSSRYVGIGTTTPQAKLDVNGDTQIGGNLSLGSPNFSYTGTSDIKAIEFPRGELMFSTTNSQNQLYMMANAYFTPSGFKYRNQAPVAGLGFDGGATRFLSAPSGSAGSLAPLTSNLTILNNGLVGIGTDTPSAKLDILSTQILGSSQGTSLPLTRISAGAFQIVAVRLRL